MHGGSGCDWLSNTFISRDLAASCVVGLGLAGQENKNQTYKATMVKNFAPSCFGAGTRVLVFPLVGANLGKVWGVWCEGSLGASLSASD